MVLLVCCTWPGLESLVHHKAQRSGGWGCFRMPWQGVVVDGVPCRTRALGRVIEQYLEGGERQDGRRGKCPG